MNFISLQALYLKRWLEQKARELYKYLNNNMEGILPYDKQGKKITEAPEGVIYKVMGVLENQNCTVITLRMKNRRMRWSVRKQRIDRNERSIYRWFDIYAADARNRRNVKCSEGSEERRNG